MPKFCKKCIDQIMKSFMLEYEPPNLAVIDNPVSEAKCEFLAHKQLIAYLLDERERLKKWQEVLNRW